MELEKLIRAIPDYPKPGILFRDITTLLKDGPGFAETVNRIAALALKRDVDLVAGVEARGFILGAAIAYKLNRGFVAIRKKGKLPGETIGEAYALEYGSDMVEMHADAVKPGQKVLLVDDLIATGGTALAAARLIRQSKGVLELACFIIELADLEGRRELEDIGIDVEALIIFEDG